MFWGHLSAAEGPIVRLFWVIPHCMNFSYHGSAILKLQWKKCKYPWTCKEWVVSVMCCDISLLWSYDQKLWPNARSCWLLLLFRPCCCGSETDSYCACLVLSTLVSGVLNSAVWKIIISLLSAFSFSSNRHQGKMANVSLRASKTCNVAQFLTHNIEIGALVGGELIWQSAIPFTYVNTLWWITSRHSDT